MITLTALLLSSIFGFLGGIHFYWGFGGRWGYADALPSTIEGKPTMAPGIVASLVVGFGLLSFAFIAALQGHLLTLALPAMVGRIGIWVIAAIFALRATGEFNYVGFFKKVRKTNFGRKDTLYYSPLCLVIALLAATLGYWG